jgi:hypothetical protein
VVNRNYYMPAVGERELDWRVPWSCAADSVAISWSYEFGQVVFMAGARSQVPICSRVGRPGYGGSLSWGRRKTALAWRKTALDLKDGRSDSGGKPSGPRRKAVLARRKAVLARRKAVLHQE